MPEHWRKGADDGPEEAWSLSIGQSRLQKEMLGRRAPSVAVAGLAVLLVAACGSSAHHYSADRFKRCLATHDVDVSLTEDVRTKSMAALVWQPNQLALLAPSPFAD
jgi:hypothetical protein